MDSETKASIDALIAKAGKWEECVYFMLCEAAGLEIINMKLGFYRRRFNRLCKDEELKEEVETACDKLYAFADKEKQLWFVHDDHLPLQ